MNATHPTHIESLTGHSGAGLSTDFPGWSIETGRLYQGRPHLVSVTARKRNVSRDAYSVSLASDGLTISTEDGWHHAKAGELPEHVVAEMRNLRNEAIAMVEQAVAA